MTRPDFRRKWAAILCDATRLQSTVPAAPLVSEILADLAEVDRAEGTELLNLTQASLRSGYSPDTLGRMIREGKLTNHGRRNAPRVCAADLPKKLRRKQSLIQLKDASRQNARVSTMTPLGGS